MNDGPAPMTDYKTLIDTETWAFIERTNSYYPPDTIDYTVAQQRGIYDRMCREFFAGYPDGVTAETSAIATPTHDIPMIILATASLFVPLHIEHPFWMAAFLVLTAVTFSLFGFIIGIWAKSFEQLQLVPLLIITPLTFLGGSFYSIHMLPGIWKTITLFNPVVYLISGFRWSFFGKADVSVGVSLGMTLAFLAVCIAIVAWIFRTGYRLRN